MLLWLYWFKKRSREKGSALLKRFVIGVAMLFSLCIRTDYKTMVYNNIFCYMYGVYFFTFIMQFEIVISYHKIGSI